MGVNKSVGKDQSKAKDSKDIKDTKDYSNYVLGVLNVFGVLCLALILTNTFIYTPSPYNI